MMRTKVHILISGLLLFFATTANAQTEYGESFKSRLYVGADFNVSFGWISLLDISPLAGYNINRHLSAGVGLTYKFYSDRTYNPAFRTNFYGGRGFLRARPFPEGLPGIFIHGEFESVNNERLALADPLDPYSPLILRREWTPAAFLGVGFRQQAGENSYFTFSLLFNLLDDGNYSSTIYNSPLVPRIGFIYGLY